MMLAWMMAGVLVGEAEGQDQRAGGDTGKDVLRANTREKTAVKAEDLPKNPGSWNLGGGGWMNKPVAKKKSTGSIRRRPVPEAAQEERSKSTGAAPSPLVEPRVEIPASQKSETGPLVAEKEEVKALNDSSGKTGETDKMLPKVLAPTQAKKKNGRKAKALGEAKDPDRGGEEMKLEVVDVVDVKRTKNLKPSANKIDSGTGGGIKTGEVSKGQVTSIPLMKPKSIDPGFSSSNQPIKRVAESKDSEIDVDFDTPGFSGMNGWKKGSPIAISTGKTTALKRPRGYEADEKSMEPEATAKIVVAPAVEKAQPPASDAGASMVKSAEGVVEESPKPLVSISSESKDGEPVVKTVIPAGKVKGENTVMVKDAEPAPLIGSKATVPAKATSSLGAVAASESKEKSKLEKSVTAATPMAASVKKQEVVKKESAMPAPKPTPKVAVSDVDTKPDSVVPLTSASVAEKTGEEKPGSVVTKSQLTGLVAGDADASLMSDVKSGEGEGAQSASGGSGSGGESGKEKSKMRKATETAAVVGVVGAVAEMDEDTLELPTWEGGYYPTQEEDFYRPGIDYPRSYGGITPQGPDNRSLNADGLFPYDNPDVVDRPNYDSLFVPTNRVMGFFAPREAYVIEGERIEGWSLASDAGMPFLTRSFDPDRAHFKAGPVYADLLYVGVGTIWSDFNGDQTFPDGQGPGWIPYIEFAPRVLLRLTDQFYLTTAARLVFMPLEGRIGFDFGYGGAPLLYTRLNYEKDWKSWDFILYDEINAGAQGLLSDFNSESFQQAGRYSFGITESNRRSNDPFDGEDLYLTNTIGAGASTAFLQEDWRLWLNAEHRDFWRSFDFDDHTVNDNLTARVGYNGDNIPFAPYVEYSGDSFDYFESVYNTVYVGASGRLTENITTEGRVGYLWTYNRDPDTESPLWELGLTHQLNENTSHSLWAGETWETNGLTNETALARYVRYNIAHRLSRRLSAAAYAQFSKEEDLVAGTPVTDRENYAGLLSYQAWEYTSLTAGVYYDRRQPEALPSITDKRWIYRAGVIQQIYSRYTLNFIYQFEDQVGTNEFNENMFEISLRRYF